MSAALLGPFFRQAIDHLWQSTIFALAAALLTLAFRKNRAQVRYWLWLSASLKFLVPFALLMSLGNTAWEALAARKMAAEIAAPAVSLTVVQITQPFSGTLAFAPSTPRPAFGWIPIAIFGLWACGFLAVALMRLRGWLRVRAVLRVSVPLEISERVNVRSTPGLLEPGVVGIFRQTLLLPEGILQSLTTAQLEAVLAHELAHVRRRDNLTATIHMLVEAIFWFYPAVWWIGARLVEERELACDEAVLLLGNQPRVYAEAILNVCKLYIESPLACVPGVTGADLKKRVHNILGGRIAVDLGLGRKLSLVVAGVASLALPMIAGFISTPSLRPQSAVGPIPKWDVISVKPCDAESNGAPGMRGGGIPPASFSPVHMMLHCQPVASYVRDAYLFFPNGQRPVSRSFAASTPIEGLPDWANTERYTIEANADGNATPEMMEGPMLQALLEDRFKLKLHHEVREVPVYDLLVAKGGPKLTPFDPASCTPFPPRPDIVTGPPDPIPQLPPGQKYCSHGGGLIGPTAVNVVVMDDGDTISDFCRDFLQSVGNDRRRVVDKTGITGKFTIHLEYAPDDATRSRLAEMGNPLGDPTAPEIFTAIQEQLGLKLVPDKGPGDFLVIDHIEQPPAN